MFVRKKYYHSVIPGLIEGGTALLGAVLPSLLDKGASGSQTTTQLPAPVDPIQTVMENEFGASNFGMAKDSDFNPILYAERYPDVAQAYGVTDPRNMTAGQAEAVAKHWQRFGKAEGRIPNADDNYYENRDTRQDRILEDTTHQEGVDRTFLDKLVESVGQRTDANTTLQQSEQQNVDNFLNSLTQSVQDWRQGDGSGIGGIDAVAKNLQPLATSGPANIMVGDQLFGQAFSKAQNTARGEYGGILGDILAQNQGVAGTTRTQQGDLAGLVNTIAKENIANQEGLAQKENIFGNLYTPNLAQNRYDDWLQGQYNAEKAMRYGIPSSTTTGEADSGFSLGKLIGDASAGLNLGSTVADLINKRSTVPDQGYRETEIGGNTFQY